MQFFVAFVATLACAAAAPSAYYPYAPAAYAAPAYGTPAYSYAAPAAYGPAADIKVLPSGFVADTPEVASAKAAHLAEKAKVSSYAPAAYAAPAYAAPAYSYAAPAYAAPAYGYAAPAYAGAYAHAPADIKVLPSGFLADTPEVAHAKAAHAAETVKSAAAAAASPDHESYAAPAYAAPAYSYAAPAYSYAAPAAYAPAADIKVLPSGFVADTPEVASAKAAHLAEKAKVSSYSYAAPAAYAAPAYSHY